MSLPCLSWNAFYSWFWQIVFVEVYPMVSVLQQYYCTLFVCVRSSCLRTENCKMHDSPGGQREAGDGQYSSVVSSEINKKGVRRITRYVQGRCWLNTVKLHSVYEDNRSIVTFIFQMQSLVNVSPLAIIWYRTNRVFVGTLPMPRFPGVVRLVGVVELQCD